ncbi:MAG: YggS family pyridoxal phosphate-dependent enzyme, partial [Clostridia bacterium]
MDRERVVFNIERIRSALRQVAPCPVELMAVTKTHTAEEANWAFDAGVARIGENRVQELMQKFPALNPQYKVDLIGQLQTNKVKYIVNCVSRIQSLDRMALALEIDRRASEAGLVMPCLVEVNIAGETQRGGVAPEELEHLVREAAKLPGIKIEGLMAVMPVSEDPEAVRPCFQSMRALFEHMRDLSVSHVTMACLSMGMSGDYL